MNKSAKAIPVGTRDLSGNKCFKVHVIARESGRSRAVGRNKRSALRRSMSNRLAEVAFCGNVARPILWK
jgi:hypothetical protein